jgi:hypothetical protein
MLANLYILSRNWLYKEYGLVIGFIARLYAQLVTTSNYSAIDNLHSAIH